MCSSFIVWHCSVNLGFFFFISHLLLSKVFLLNLLNLVFKIVLIIRTTVNGVVVRLLVRYFRNELHLLCILTL